MKCLLIFFAISSVLITGAIVSQTAQAQDFVMTPEHEQRVRQNCVAAQATLYQLHASDALLRVNLGPLYENISTKLMAPLNSRIAINRQQGLKLAATTLEYDRRVDIFRADYREYEKSMSNTLDIKCEEKPIDFYASVLATREKRQRLREDTEALITLIQAYKTEFEDFSLKINGGTE